MKRMINNKDFGLVGKLIPAETCSALVVRRCGYMLTVPGADFEPVCLCLKCMHKLTAMYDAVIYDGLHSVYEVEKFECVFNCELCGDGMDVEFKELLEDWELVAQ